MRDEKQEKFLLSENFLWALLIVSTVIIVFILVLFINGRDNSVLQNFAPWLQCFLMILVVFIGGVYVRIKHGKTRKGGTKYYNFKYHTLELEENFLRYCNKFSEWEQVDRICWRERFANKNENEYWETVYYLQDLDDDFVKAWHDLNFYEGKKNLTDLELKYFLLVKKYVYLKVYDTYTKQCNKSIFLKNQLGDNKKFER